MPLMTRWYFAYGSNMNPERVTARGLTFDTVRPGVLPGVRLTFDKQSREHPRSGHANLTFDPNGQVEGVLYQLRGSEDIVLMDRFERTPINYSREIVEVQAAGEAVLAWTYFANPAVIGSNLRPERAYLAHLLAGRAYLSDSYHAFLATTVCVDE
jgi:cation transport regulator ChaC